MASSSKFADQKNFAIKVNYCDCDGCNGMLEKLRVNYGMKIDTDSEPRYATIRGTGDPNPIIEKVKRSKNWWKLRWEPSPHMSNQRKQIVLSHKSVPQVPMTLTVLDESIAKKADYCHRNRNHGLKLKLFSKRFTCNGCKEDGFGRRFRCDQCNYELHEVCNSRKPTIFCDLFKGSAFEFCNNKGHTKSCYACGNDIHGYSYHCKSEDLYLHPPCSKLSRQLNLDGTVFVLRDKNKVLSDCLWCNTKKPSSCSYVSRCNEYKFHVRCILEMVHEAWKQGANNTKDASKALETMKSKRMAKDRNREGGRSKVLWKIVNVVLRVIVSVLSGNPLELIAAPLAALLSN